MVRGQLDSGPEPIWPLAARTAGLLCDDDDDEEALCATRSPTPFLVFEVDDDDEEGPLSALRFGMPAKGPRSRETNDRGH